MARRAAVVIACCRREAGAPATELYPDPDSEGLRDGLAQLGHRAALASWDDPGVAWDEAAAVVLRSTWDSVDRPAAFLAWAAQVARCSVLLNPLPVVNWNLDKAYLRELAGAGVPVVPTTWVAPGCPWSPPRGDYVVKPSVSAGGRETAWYGPRDATTARAHVARLSSQGHTVMVQPHLAAVAEPGELSVVFIDGVYSHAFRRGPQLARGAGVLDRPWERITVFGPDQPRPADLAAAGAALGAVRHRFPGALTYARVDLIDGQDGNPLVTEVELIDPGLGLTLGAGSTERLARAVAGQVTSRASSAAASTLSR